MLFNRGNYIWWVIRSTWDPQIKCIHEIVFGITPNFHLIMYIQQSYLNYYLFRQDNQHRQRTSHSVIQFAFQHLKMTTTIKSTITKNTHSSTRKIEIATCFAPLTQTETLQFHSHQKLRSLTTFLSSQVYHGSFIGKS